MPALDKRILDDRTRSRELRHLAELRRKAKSVVLRRRLQVVLLFLQGRLTAAAIAKRAGVSRATAFVYWRCYRESGSDGLLKMRPVGRPRGIPAFARDRFDYLVRPELFGGHERPLVYIVEREMRVFHAAWRPCRANQISRWFRRYVQENGLVRRVRRFRRFAQGYRHLWWDDRLDGLGLLNPCFSWARRLRADALLYASKLRPARRSIYRRALAASFAVPVSRVAFRGDRRERSGAEVVWNGHAAPWPPLRCAEG